MFIPFNVNNYLKQLEKEGLDGPSTRIGEHVFGYGLERDIDMRLDYEIKKKNNHDNTDSDKYITGQRTFKLKVQEDCANEPITKVTKDNVRKYLSQERCEIKGDTKGDVGKWSIELGEYINIDKFFKYNKNDNFGYPKNYLICPNKDVAEKILEEYLEMSYKNDYFTNKRVYSITE